MAQTEKPQVQDVDAYMPDHGSEAELSPRWVRVKFGGETIADSKRVLLLRESRRLPVYYFPKEDVRMALLESSGHSTPSHTKGRASYWTIKVGDQVAENAAWSHFDPPPERADVKGYVAFVWKKMDHWFEEEEEVFVHARDPYKRVDVIPSSRHVKVVIDGETVADSKRPYLLFETSLPTRYYIPREDVRMDLLEATDTHTRCPYKGIASYWTAKIGDKVYEDIVWSYPEPIPEAPKIKELLAFYNEKVDTYVDGELQPRPKTPWS